MPIRRHLPCIVLLLALGALYLPWTWSGQLGDLGGDSAVYVLTARAYSPYLEADAAPRAFADNSQFPPLYPLVLALAGGGVDLHVAHAVTTLALIAAFAGLYAWLIAMGTTVPLAIAGVAAFAALPGTRIHSLLLHSENLYVACAFSALAALSAAMRRGAAPLYWVACGLIAAALLTRTAGLALLPALAIALWRGRPRAWPLMLGGAVGPALAWNLWHRPGNSYTAGLAAEYGKGGFAELVHRLTQNAGATMEGLLDNWVQTTALDHAVIPLLLAAAGAALVRLRRFEPDAWYLAAYLGILAIWPYPGEGARFAWVICPSLIGCLVWGVGAMQKQMGERAPALRRALPSALALGLALILAPGLHLNIQRYRHPLAAAYPELRTLPEWYGPDLGHALREAQIHVALVDALQALGSEVPADDCVLAIKPALVTFYTGRFSVSPPPSSADPPDFEQQLRATSCHYALLLPIKSTTFSAAHYPAARLPEPITVIAERTIRKEGASEYKMALVTFGEPDR